MELHYKKSANKTLFVDFANPVLLNVTAPQNYVPLYSRFFTLNNTNFNNINLNHTNVLTNVLGKTTENKFLAKIRLEDDSTVERPVFFKLSPLLDPIKFLIGKYEKNDDILVLPSLDAGRTCEKLSDANNASYVDSFFTYLTSKLLHAYNFLHGVDFYGSYLAIKNDYKINIYDDIEYLQDSSYFKKYNNVERNNITFRLDSEYLNDIMPNQSRQRREKINLGEAQPDTGKNILNLSDISDISELEQFDTIFSPIENKSNASGESMNLLYEGRQPQNRSASNTSSSCSSRSSDTNSEGGSVRMIAAAARTVIQNFPVRAATVRTMIPRQALLRPRRPSNY